MKTHSLAPVTAPAPPARARTLPKLFDIFSPRMSRKPLCSQYRAIVSMPWAQQLWAISFSWCGKIRSRPPAWMSNGSGPRKRLAHGRAFDVPAGAAVAPGAVPAGLVVGRRLPQDEVGRVALVGGDVDPRAGDLLVAVAAGEAAVGRHRGHGEQDVALGGVGVAALDQRGDQRDHARAHARWRAARGSAAGSPGRRGRPGTRAVVRSVSARMSLAVLRAPDR